MPVPRPGEKESQSDFMSRCMRFMHTENQNKTGKDKRPQKQLVAICFSQWSNMHSSDKSMASTTEINNDFIVEFLKKYPQYKEYFESEDDRQE